MKKIIVLMFLFAFAIFAADVKLPVQGILSDADGNPLNGTHAITFSLYDMDVDGNAVWSEDAEIEIDNGEFSYMLGETDFIDSSVLENASPLWLGVRIGDEVMSPRIELGVESKSIYSYNSGKLEGKTVEDIKTEINTEKLNSILSRLDALESANTDKDQLISDLKTRVETLETENTDKEQRIAELETANHFSGSYNDLSDKPDFTGWDTNASDDFDGNYASLNGKPTLFDGNYNSLTNKPATITNAQATAITQNSSDISSHNTRISIIETKTASMSVLTDNGYNTVRFMGVNLQVVSGSGSTAGQINGTGNIIVGYNEARSSGSDKTGSHNLIVGTEHNYNTYASVVFGDNNSVIAPYSSVSGGISNTASGAYSSVSGGIHNTASENYSSVSGGSFNIASGNYSSVSGGSYNIASGAISSVSGGNNNTASGAYSSIGGGAYNIASGLGSSISGGAHRNVSGNNDWRAGSLFEEN